FLYGPAGVGKTHLLHAIANHIVNSKPDQRLILISGDVFMNELIHSIRYYQVLQFREKYRNSDVLMLDDIHLLIGKERSQEELFLSLNALANTGTRLAFASSCAPKNLATFLDPLQSRLSMGLVLQHKPPTEEELFSILSKKFSTLQP